MYVRVCACVHAHVAAHIFCSGWMDGCALFLVCEVV